MYCIHRCLLITNIIIVPVLVFTWIMGLFAVEGQEKIYAILFVLANVLQVKERISCYKLTDLAIYSRLLNY